MPFERYFNSSMVRLKDGAGSGFDADLLEFQFQYGAIERRALDPLPPATQLFQFQYGAIERES